MVVRTEHELEGAIASHDQLGLAQFTWMTRKIRDHVYVFPTPLFTLPSNKGVQDLCKYESRRDLNLTHLRTYLTYFCCMGYPSTGGVRATTRSSRGQRFSISWSKSTPMMSIYIAMISGWREEGGSRTNVHQQHLGYEAPFPP